MPFLVLGVGVGDEGTRQLFTLVTRKGERRGLETPDVGERQAEVGGTSDGDEVRR